MTYGQKLKLVRALQTNRCVTDPRLMLGVVLALAGMEEIMCQHGLLGLQYSAFTIYGNCQTNYQEWLRRWLPDGACAEFRRLYYIYRAGYNRLSLSAAEASKCRYPQRPKNHHWEHLTLDTLPRNPRYMHNYQSEDMVKKIKALAIGSHPAYLSKHVALKYVLQCGLRWRQQ